MHASDHGSPGASSRLIQPTPAFDIDIDHGRHEVLRPDQVASWRNQGFALVDGVFEQELIDDVRDNCCNAPKAGKKESIIGLDNGFAGILFPSLEKDTQCVNRITLHPRLLAACAQLLGCPEHDMRLSQSELWLKHNNQQPDNKNSKDAKNGVDSVPSTADPETRTDVPLNNPFDTSGSQVRASLSSLSSLCSLSLCISVVSVPLCLSPPSHLH